MSMTSPDTPADPAYEAHLQETITGAAAVLSRSLGRTVHLEQEESFRGARSRSTVLRCRVSAAGGGADGVPRSVIVKRFRGDGGGPNDSDARGQYSARARLVNEWAGTRFLDSIQTDRPFGPACDGGDGRLGLVLLDDLGTSLCLADFLQGDDPTRAEPGLLAYATTLGRLHAATVGQRHQYDAVRRAVAAGGIMPEEWQPGQEWRTEGLPAFWQACTALDLPVSAACEAELDRVGASMEAPGPFLAFSVSDTCPDNHRYVEPVGDASGARSTDSTGEVGYLRFFDMEFGSFRHAMLDAAYVWLPFPTCWCVNRLPADLPPRLEAAHRAELVKGCPAAADNGLFGRALVKACAWWLVTTVQWNFRGAAERDSRWGISSVRQRYPLRAENVAAVAERYRHLEAFGALARDFSSRLRARWGADAEMPIYPPFRGP